MRNESARRRPGKRNESRGQLTQLVSGSSRKRKQGRRVCSYLDAGRLTINLQTKDKKKKKMYMCIVIWFQPWLLQKRLGRMYV